MTVLADFEDASVGARIAAANNVSVSDCSAELASIPARGQRSMAVSIGATRDNVSATARLRFRDTAWFPPGAKLVAHAWLNEGSVGFAFRLRDSDGRVWETPQRRLGQHYQWMRILEPLTAENLSLVAEETEDGEASADDAARLEGPLEVLGWRVWTYSRGRQVAFIDDLEIEHEVTPRDVVRGEFHFDRPTQIYEPSDTIRATVQLENQSRTAEQRLSVRLSWLDAEDREVTTSQKQLVLPPSGLSFRSRKSVDFSQRIAEPGLYRLVAEVRSAAWPAPRVFETTIAVTPSNRALPRGRATFFGVWSDLLREPLLDQLLELDVAHEIGVHLVAVQTPWSELEPAPGEYDFSDLERIANEVVRRDMALMVALNDPPAWTTPGAQRRERQERLLVALVENFGRRVEFYAWAADEEDAVDRDALQRVEAELQRIQRGVELLPPPVPLSAIDAGSGIERGTFVQTDGDPRAAIAAMREVASAERALAGSRWLHRAAPVRGAGTSTDAIALLRYFVEAAQHGAAGAIWFDLRDNARADGKEAALRGLVRRDFSPKNALIGYANTVGALSGLQYAGRLYGTPDTFDSALFMGGNRQVAILFPKPNRILPAVLVPHISVVGQLTASDFERRSVPLLRTPIGNALPTSPRPVFLTLTAERAQAESQMLLRVPWIDAPGTVLCDEQGLLTVRVTAPIALRRSYVRLLLPAESGLESDFSARALTLAEGESQSFDIALRATGGRLQGERQVTLRFSIEGDTVDIPIAVRPLHKVPQVAGSFPAQTDVLGEIRTGRGQRADATLHAAWDSGGLFVAWTMPDADRDGALRLTAAAEGGDRYISIRVDDPFGEPTPAAIWPDRAPFDGWTARAEPAGSGARCIVEIPAKALDAALRAGQRLLLGAAWVPDAPSSEPLQWGEPEQSGTARGLNWLELKE